MANFAQFITFPIFSPPKQLIFHQIFISGEGGIHWPISPDLQLFKSFPTKAAQNDPQWPTLPLKLFHLHWLKMANFVQFSTFPIFFHKKQLKLTRNGQFHLIYNFSNLFPPKWLIICQISKFSFLGVGGVHWPIFPDLQLFKSLPTEVDQNNPQWQILPPKWFRSA